MARHDNARTKGKTDRGGVTLPASFFCGPLTGEVRPSGFFRAARRTNHQLTGEVTHTQLEKWETTRQDSI
jgi:hypothetical protein